MSTQYGLDSFTRSNVSGSWGTATDGQTYTQARGNQTLSITSNEGVMTFNGSTTTGVMTMGSTKVGDGMWLVRCVQTGTSDIMGIAPRYKDTNNFYSFVQGSTAGQFQLRLDNAGTFTTVAGVAFTSTAGTFYWIRCAIIGTSFFGKIWTSGTSEPNTWQIGALGVTDSTIAGPQNFGLVGTPNTTGNTVKFDSFYAIDYTNSDSIPIADVGGNLERWPVDSLTSSDSLLQTDGATFIESNQAGDLGGVQRWNLDALPVSDIGGARQWPLDGLAGSDMGGSLQQWNVDGLVGVETGGVQSWQGDNALVISDATTFADGSTSVDSLTASTLITYGDATGFIEGNTVASNALAINQSSFIDNNVASDVGCVRQWNVDSLQSSSALTDTNIYLPIDLSVVSSSLLATDIATLIDQSTVNDPGSGLTQSGGSITNNNMSSTDSLIVSDIGGLQQWDIASSIVSSSLNQGGGYNPADNLIIADGFTSTNSILAIEICPANSSLTSTGSVSFVDSNTVISAITSASSFNALEPLTIISTLVANTALQSIDALAIVDASLITLQMRVLDTLVISDIGGLQAWGMDANAISESVLFSASGIFVEIDVVSDTGSGLTPSSTNQIYVSFNALISTGNFSQIVLSGNIRATFSTGNFSQSASSENARSILPGTNFNLKIP